MFCWTKLQEGRGFPILSAGFKTLHLFPSSHHTTLQKSKVSIESKQPLILRWHQNAVVASLHLFLDIIRIRVSCWDVFERCKTKEGALAAKPAGSGILFANKLMRDGYWLCVMRCIQHQCYSGVDPLKFVATTKLGSLISIGVLWVKPCGEHFSHQGPHSHPRQSSRGHLTAVGRARVNSGWSNKCKIYHCTSITQIACMLVCLDRSLQICEWTNLRFSNTLQLGSPTSSLSFSLQCA